MMVLLSQQFLEFLILGPEERLEPGIEGLCLSESSGLVGGVGRRSARVTLACCFTCSSSMLTLAERLLSAERVLVEPAEVQDRTCCELDKETGSVTRLLHYKK